MSIHTTAHPFARQTVTLPASVVDLGGQQYRIEDWWDRVAGGSWMFAQGNPACLQYAVRAAVAGVPTDDEVVYGKVNGLGYLVHVSEFAGVQP